MPLILGTNSIKDTGYDVANSCRFDDGSSAYMTKTPGSDGNRQTFTISVWCKRGTLGSAQNILGSSDSNFGNGLFFQFQSDDTFRFGFQDPNQFKATNRVFRDCSAWYNIIVAVDVNQASNSDRVKIYVNGTQETSFATDNTMTDVDKDWNNQQAHSIGRSGAHDNQYFDGYLAEVVSIDGSQLTASSFGEFDEDSPKIWKPKDVSGLTFGTNGFYLDFEDSSNLGNDANGGTDFTENNLAAVDQSTDTPTNNFATLNPLHYESRDNTFAEGNLKITSTGSDSWTTHYGISTIAVSSGKWYVESKVTTVKDSQAILGLISTSQTIGSSLKDNGVAAVEKSGRITGGGNNIETGLTAWSNGDIAGLAFDATNGTAQFYRNGSAYGSSAVSSIASGTYYFATTTYDGSGGVVEFNFGSPPYTISSGNADGNGYGNFEYSVPTNYYSLCTKNLAEFG